MHIRHLIFATIAAVSLAAFAVLSVPFIDTAGGVSYLAVMARETFHLDVAAVLMLIGIASILAVARPSPAAFRAFWLRLTNRTDHLGVGSTI